MSTSFQQARLTRDPRFDGRFFIAVKTTRIFCRSVCPAKPPLEKNVEYFNTAHQAMNAGFRPCLRCRPDSAPNSFAWQGVDTTVQRAVRLLSEFKQLSIEKIAEKLGVSSRYLRLLFEQKLGMSPKQYQQFDKVLFAKQLLHQSQLPIEQIAQASGFASARRLQHNFKQVTGLTPTQIRQVNPTPQQSITLKLAYRPPYNWQHMHTFLAARAIQSIETTDNLCYSRSFTLAGHKGWFSVSAEPLHNYLNLEIRLADIRQLSKVLINIQRMFDVNADINTIQSAMLASGIPEKRLTTGLRLPGVWDTFEAGCRAILGQQISVKAAINLLTFLANELGEYTDGIRYFPTPEAIANSPLAFLKIPQRRKQTLIDFAQFMQNTTNSDPEQWLDIKGIGPWTVAYGKMRGQSGPDIWLDTDLIIKKQLNHYPIDAEQGKPWRSYLTLQLWSMHD